MKQSTFVSSAEFDGFEYHLEVGRLNHLFRDAIENLWSSATSVHGKQEYTWWMCQLRQKNGYTCAKPLLLHRTRRYPLDGREMQMGKYCLPYQCKRTSMLIQEC